MEIEILGQGGFKIQNEKLNFLIDPYLSNSVQELDSQDLVRKLPIPYDPHCLKNIDYVLITHTHIDHCDPHTIPIIYEENPKCKFLCPYPVKKQLLDWGFKEKRIHLANQNYFRLSENILVRSIPAAHPKINIGKDNQPEVIGWIIKNETNNDFIYFAGDTSIDEKIMQILKTFKELSISFLPVNEDNFFRRKRGIIGNMSIREAFEMATIINTKKVVPVHWDMFKANGAEPEEIESVYNSQEWSFQLELNKKIIRC